MNRIPSDETILHLLDHLDDVPADALESEMLDFKRWEGARKSLSGAVEAAVCFANAEGGLVVFGVKDQTKSRTNAITGCERYDLDVWRRGIYEGTRPLLTVDVSELEIPEGRLILVRVPKGPAPPYGTANFPTPLTRRFMTGSSKQNSGRSFLAVALTSTIHQNLDELIFLKPDRRRNVGSSFFLREAEKVAKVRVYGERLLDNLARELRKQMKMPNPFPANQLRRLCALSK